MPYFTGKLSEVRKLILRQVKEARNPDYECALYMF